MAVEGHNINRFCDCKEEAKFQEAKFQAIYLSAREGG